MGSYIQSQDLIKEELNRVDLALKNIGNDIAATSTQDVFNHFFKMSGKYLRPTLILLSANAVNPDMNSKQKEQLVNLSVAVELIHSASLVHDDIIDGDLFRRGQKTLNNVFGRKIAILAGDTLYAKAFSILSHSLPRESEQVITQVIEKMCVAEIEQAKEGEITKEKYLKIINGKTASFMSACCKLGAALAGVEDYVVEAMEGYGLSLGMTYQIIDDCIDEDVNAGNDVTIKDAQLFAEKALASLAILEQTDYKQGLESLLNYVLGLSKSVA